MKISPPMMQEKDCGFRITARYYCDCSAEELPAGNTFGLRQKRRCRHSNDLSSPTFVRIELSRLRPLRRRIFHKWRRPTTFESRSRALANFAANVNISLRIEQYSQRRTCSSTCSVSATVSMPHIMSTMNPFASSHDKSPAPSARRKCGRCDSVPPPLMSCPVVIGEFSRVLDGKGCRPAREKPRQ